jgi:hypothetical protein
MPEVEEMEDLYRTTFSLRASPANFVSATEFRLVITEFLKNFKGGPRTVEDVIKFYLDNADKEFTDRRSRFATWHGQS